MENYSQKILDLLTQRPALRPVQIADLLDIDIDVVENTLLVLAKDGKVVGQPGIAPNKLPMTTYSLPPGALNWSAPTQMTRAPVAAPVTATVTTSEEKTLSKTQKGMEFLRNASGKVFVKDLCEAMGLEYPKYSPRQYFSNQIRLGEVVCDGKWYVIGTPGERTTPLKQKTKVAIKPVEKAKAEISKEKEVTSELDNNLSGLKRAMNDLLNKLSGGEVVEEKPVMPTPTVMTSLNQNTAFDVFGFLQTSLSADEWRGYMKANVIDLTLRGDYAAAYEYAGRLAAAQV